MKFNNQIFTFLGVLFLLNIGELIAQENSKLKFFSDFRFRAELDRDSEKMDGSLRADRDRFRYRLRAGITYNLNENIEFGGRIRSGNPKNQQSSHVTLGKEFHSDEFSIDRAYLKLTSKNGYWASFGKNALPLWEQNELLWDEDVNPEGISIGKSFDIGNKQVIVPVGGYYIVGNSEETFAMDSKIIVGQLKYAASNATYKLVVASGLVMAKELPNTPDDTQSYVQDYTIWVTNIQLNKGKYTFGFDYFKNLENYTDNSVISELYKDEKAGYGVSLVYKNKKWDVGYGYAYIEKFAVINYFAQDDWVRWGNDTMTSSSNFKGHELNFRYSVNSNFNVVLRGFKVEGIKTSGSNLETGSRVRLDLNIRL